MSILELLTGQLNNQDTLKSLGQSVGADPGQVQQLAQLGLPALMQALGRNASSLEGAEALAGALEQHQDANVDDVAGFLNNANTDDGAKILQHIFSGKNERLQNNLAQQTGLDAGQVSGLMTKFAPLMLGVLGQQKKERNLDAAGVSGLLNSAIGQSGDSGIMGMVTKLLDADGDGNVIDDVGKLLGGFLKK